MGFYPYDCEACGGAYSRCGNSTHRSKCKGGQFCWEDAVVCEVIKIVIGDPDAKDIDGLITLQIGDILEGDYDGGGAVNVEGFEENQIFTKGEYGEDPHEGSNFWKNYALVKIWCASCYPHDIKK